MLTALELYGFKSFAERTRFEFPAGITVVVGPNGSGKSNVVDAIKWVLGEQSAKSLRGKEMADVIFKGTSGPGGRKPANTAEASIFIDNTSRRLGVDADEVKLTRRVFRSGEGEYLINGEPCRLKDIRNLTRGTGIGVDAYSLIEQGKVDQLLKASPKDRRAMFEEAAGISRFKAKKIEAERRLGRVEQNLVRLADIVEEVGNRFRKVKSQATKAARYKDLTVRLQELRTDVGAKDWRDFTRHLEQFAAEKDRVQKAIATATQEQKALETQATDADRELSRWSSRIVAAQENANQVVQEITRLQSQVVLHQSRADDLNVQVASGRESLKRDAERVGQLDTSREEAATRLAESEQLCTETSKQLEEVVRTETELQAHIAERRAEAASRREQLGSLTSQASELGRELASTESRLQMTTATRERQSKALEQTIETHSTLTDSITQLQATCDQLKDDAAAKDSALAAAQEERNQVSSLLQQQQRAIDDNRRQQTGATQRAEVLQELENRLEGVDLGVRDLIERAKRSNEDILRDVVGLVADMIKVNVQHAELVDLALGPYAQSLVVEGERLIQAIAQGSLRPAGRIRLLRKDRPPTLGAQPGLDLQGYDGVVGRLDQLVETDPASLTFVTSLLGGTWLVKTLGDAFRLAREFDGQARFVTLAGELLEADGTLIAGPRTTAGGLVSRRSELRALHREIHELSTQIREQAASIDATVKRRDRLEADVQRLFNENSGLSQKLADHMARLQSLEKERDTAQKQRAALRDELDELDVQIADGERTSQSLRAGAAKAEQEATRIRRWLDDYEAGAADTEKQLTDLQHRQTALKVQLARTQQQRLDAESAFESHQSRIAELQAVVVETRSSMARMLWQIRGSRREARQAGEALQGLESKRSQLDSELSELKQRRQAADDSRRGIARRLDQVRDEVRNLTDKSHGIDLQERQLTLERQQLATRLQDDYGIDIARLESADDEGDVDREAVDQEITELRTAIANIGSVNMEALNELDEMQQRFETLETQYQDLVDARQALERIIHRINNDSRRLFSETLEAIRANFQVLFRQTFGGGRADLVLEEGVDILEAGIDIMATPPGKPEFNNSLLSGGERALTAVSLLMAVFQFRPSPFCVLDEVDAPFDEANIGRFIDVLKSFLGWTRFIIVTHSKRTMTAANTLYGVTMQESGVSKKVSVRFEDVSEDGHIDAAAVDRDSKNDEDGEDDDEARTVA